jgi:hypothetical protein
MCEGIQDIGTYFGGVQPAVPPLNLPKKDTNGDYDGNNGNNYNNDSSSSYNDGDGRGRVPNKTMQAMDQDDDEEGINQIMNV